MAYKSSVLRCDVKDHDCIVCHFLAGGHCKSTLLAVIALLDHKLAEAETFNHTLTVAMVDTLSQESLAGK